VSTSAIFFVGKGPKAEFLFGHSFDGYPQDSNGSGVPKTLLRSSSEEQFMQEVATYINRVPKDHHYESTTSWAGARGTSYIYAFFDGHVWITQGHRWFNPFIRAKRPSSLPPPPITRKGKIEGQIEVKCGECNDIKTATVEQLLHVTHRATTRGDMVNLLVDYFWNKGWRKTRQQGWLCPRCLRTS
jgi:hypothetical protein